MSAVYRALLIVGALSLLAGMVAHFIGPFAMTSSRGFLALAMACWLLAIAIAVGPLLEGSASAKVNPAEEET